MAIELKSAELELLRSLGGLARKPGNPVVQVPFPGEVELLESLGRYGLIEITDRTYFKGGTEFTWHLTHQGWQRYTDTKDLANKMWTSLSDKERTLMAHLHKIVDLRRKDIPLPEPLFQEEDNPDLDSLESRGLVAMIPSQSVGLQGFRDVSLTEKGQDLLLWHD